MRLSVEAVKELLLSPDLRVRQEAIRFFGRGRGDDPSLMPVVIQAYERYGVSAFGAHYTMSSLAQTVDSAAWLCRQLESVDPETSDEANDFLSVCADALRQCQPAVLKPLAGALSGLTRLDGESKREIATRIALADLPPNELWNRLESCCRDADQFQERGQQVDAAFDCVAALERFSDACRERVLETLERQKGDWLEVMATRLAGRLRLEAAIPLLIELLCNFDTWAAEEAKTALARIGGDAVLERLASLYDADVEFRFEVAGLLGYIHCDASVSLGQKLLAAEQDPELRMFLAWAILDNLSSEGIEAARQLILESPKTPELMELREALLVTCRMLDVRIPEYDEWLADSENDDEFRKSWYREHPRFGRLDAADDEFDEEIAVAWKAAMAEARAGSDAPSAAPIVNQLQHVGRNDPCPCGSGKKYKKCCLHKSAAT